MSSVRILPPEIKESEANRISPKARIVNSRSNISTALCQEISELLPLSKKLVCIDDTEYEKKLDKLARRCEKLTLNVRSLLTGVSNKESFVDSVDTKATSVSEENGTVLVKTISVLPHRKSDSTYFYNELYGAVKRYAEKHEVKRYGKDAVVVISHVTSYDAVSRDYDNYETKALIDIVALFFLVGDNPECMKLYQESVYGEKPYTEIRIMTYEAFKKYIC